MSEWFQQRKWLNVVVVIIVVVLAWRMKVIIDGLSAGEETRGSDTISDDCWYYDTGSGALFRAPRSQVPPIKGPSGSDAVWATVHGCGGCGEGQRFISYMTSHTPALKAKAESDPGAKAALYAERCPGRLYSTDGKTWIAADNADEAGVIDRTGKRCPDGNLRRCP